MKKSASDRRMIKALEDAYQLDQLAEIERPNRSWGMVDSMRWEANAISRQMAEEMER